MCRSFRGIRVVSPAPLVPPVSALATVSSNAPLKMVTPPSPPLASSAMSAAPSSAARTNVSSSLNRQGPRPPPTLSPSFTTPTVHNCRRRHTLSSSPPHSRPLSPPSRPHPRTPPPLPPSASSEMSTAASSAVRTKASSLSNPSGLHPQRRRLRHSRLQLPLAPPVASTAAWSLTGLSS